jgi:hypothetical protein
VKYLAREEHYVFDTALSSSGVPSIPVTRQPLLVPQHESLTPFDSLLLERAFWSLIEQSSPLEKTYPLIWNLVISSGSFRFALLAFVAIHQPGRFLADRDSIDTERIVSGYVRLSHKFLVRAIDQNDVQAVLHTTYMLWSYDLCVDRHASLSSFIHCIGMQAAMAELMRKKNAVVAPDEILMIQRFAGRALNIEYYRILFDRSNDADSKRSSLYELLKSTANIEMGALIADQWSLSRMLEPFFYHYLLLRSQRGVEDGPEIEFVKTKLEAIVERVILGFRQEEFGHSLEKTSWLMGARSLYRYYSAIVIKHTLRTESSSAEIEDVRNALRSLVDCSSPIANSGFLTYGYHDKFVTVTRLAIFLAALILTSQSPYLQGRRFVLNLADRCA